MCKVACLHAKSQRWCVTMQRRRTAEDEINMRTIFKEGDLLSVSFQTAA